MKGKNDSLLDNKGQKREEIEEAIFGNKEDCEEELAEEVLESYGLSAEILLEKLKIKMQAKVREKYKKKDEDISNLTGAIKSLSNSQKLSREINEPKNWIPNILAGGMGGNSQIAHAQRSKNSEIPSEKDKSILNEMEDNITKDEMF